MTDSLRRLAERATRGEWMYRIVTRQLEPTDFTDKHLADAGSNRLKSDMDYIAACSPDRILALLDELDAAKAEVERLSRVLAEEKRLSTERLQAQMDIAGERDTERRRADANLRSYNRARDERDLVSAARDEACEHWQAHLTGAIKRAIGGEDGGYRAESDRINELRAVGK